jgi:hypothetical protein
MPTARSRRVGVGSGDEQDILSADDLTGGLDLRASPTQLGSDRARRNRNWSLEEPGALIVERGYDAHLTSSVGAGSLQGGERIYLATGAFTLIAEGGDIFKVTDGGAPGSAAASGLHATNPVDFVYDRLVVFALDGSTTPVKSLDGATWSQLGIPAPTVPPTAAAVAGGALIVANTYEVSYAYRDATAGTGETGNESARVSQATAGANLTVRVTVTGVATTTGIDTIVIYVRNTTAGEEVRREVGTVANPGASTTTFDILGPDSGWETGTEPFTTHNVALPMRFGVYWKNRFWGADVTVGNRLRFTELFLQQAWPTLFYVDIPFQRGDKLEAALPLGDTLVCFGKTSMVLIVGQTSLDFEVRPAFGPQDGALGFRAVADVEGQILHVGATGAFLFDGASDRNVSYDIELGWRDYIKNASAVAISKTPVVYHKYYKRVRIGVSRLYPYGTAGEWVLDLTRTREKEHPAWSSTSRNVSGYLYWDGDENSDGNRERLFAWPSTGGTLNELEVGSDLDGADQAAEFETAEFLRPLFEANFLELHIDCEANSGLFSIEIYVNRRLVSTQTVNIGTDSAKYGTAKYGVDTYSSTRRITQPLTLPLTAEGRTIHLRGIYTGRQRFRWYGFRIPHVPEQALRGL